MPGALFKNGSCYYFSSNKEKLSWHDIYKWTNRFPQISLLVIKNNAEFDFVRNEILRIKQKEVFQEQLIYQIGFNYSRINGTEKNH